MIYWRVRRETGEDDRMQITTIGAVALTFLLAGVSAGCMTDSGSGGRSGAAGQPGATQGSTVSGASGVGASGVGASGPVAGTTPAPASSVTASAAVRSAAAGSAAARPAAPRPSRGWWRPARGVSWQWQLHGTLDLSANVQVYDVDLFTTSAAQVQALHARGRKVICYLNAGAYEPYRPDSEKYPKVVLGNALEGWPDERWLDVRRLDLLQPLLAARLDLCRSKGFDGVEPDNLEAYDNGSGFPISAADQLRFNRRVAELAHARGLAIGLKNDLDQAAALEPYFDFAVNEECMQYGECSTLSVFIRAGKPVLHVEYELAPGAFCPTTRRLGFSSMRKNLNLDAARSAC
jgi:hypothetical protein